ncbi:hypothetical protein HDV05_000673, partial [Chytridiales sp. JEL 0842]
MDRHTQTPPLDENVYENAVVDHQLLSSQEELVSAPGSVAKVLILYTGGTIGMKNHRHHGYTPAKGFMTKVLSSMRRFHNTKGIPYEETPEDLIGDPLPGNLSNPVNLPLKYAQSDGLEPNRELRQGQPSVVINGTPVTRASLPAMMTPISLYGKRIRFSVLEYEPLMDSSNMNMKDWVKIATDIEVNYHLYDAFLILHGTDTMAYTASALSFMLEDLGKSVILTGSQVPLAEVRNDAVENLLGALTIAGHFVIPEVTLFFAQKLYRGNRSSKVDAYDFNAFDSPNLRPLVTVGINI